MAYVHQYTCIIMCMYPHHMIIIKNHLVKIHWAKLSQYPQYMDFHGNTFAVQGQDTYILYLELKIHRKNFHATLSNHKCLAQ